MVAVRVGAGLSVGGWGERLLVSVDDSVQLNLDERRRMFRPCLSPPLFPLMMNFTLATEDNPPGNIYIKMFVMRSALRIFL